MTENLFVKTTEDNIIFVSYRLLDLFFLNIFHNKNVGKIKIKNQRQINVKNN